ncbi:MULTISPECIES: glutathione S-transferase [unclassified Xanthobacter]|uniref:glutathione S-transferase n=1 Tax=unclassified Xanthobacter TaxID=2623496 RepID=UPI001EDE4195|nr:MULTISPECIES: glutathione S-transferase [unclassified Xanthobacter]
MKLLHSTASPFVRKVMVLAHETGLADQLTLVPCVVSPVARDGRVVPHNPSGHIPALILDDGEALYDSVVICQYLDTLHQGRPLHPPAGMPRARTLCLQALADGIMDAAVLIRFETALRPAELRWPAWIEGQGAKIVSSLDALQAIWRSHLDGPLDMGVIAVACALGYLDFRLTPQAWRPQAPELARWYDAFARRPSMVATVLKPVA